MGRTSSTTHRWLFHVKATSATLLTRNSALIEVGSGTGNIEKIGRIGQIEKIEKIGL